MTSPLLLDGCSLRSEHLRSFTPGQAVAVDAAALARVDRAQRLLEQAAADDVPIYGFNRGVGVLQSEGVAGREAQARFNHLQACSTAAGTDLDLPEVDCARVLVIKLNEFLGGRSGVSRATVDRMIRFLDGGIYPCLPAAGSSGMGDICLLSQISLALIGEAPCWREGQRLGPREVRDHLRADPLELTGKDALAMMSSNAFAKNEFARAVEALAALSSLLDRVYLFSLEAIHGSPVPLLATTNRRFVESLGLEDARVLPMPEGSDICGAVAERRIQDPLSFRCFGLQRLLFSQRLEQAQQMVAAELNLSDENPSLFLDLPEDEVAVLERFVSSDDEGDAFGVIPTAQFNTLGWVLALESFKILLAHVARNCASRCLRHIDPRFNGRARFYGTDANPYGIGYFTRVVSELQATVRQLAAPTSYDYLVVEEGVEDAGTNSVLVCRNVREMVTKVEDLLVYEALASLMGLVQDEGRTLSASSERLLGVLRAEVPDTQRPFSAVDAFLATKAVLTHD